MLEPDRAIQIRKYIANKLHSAMPHRIVLYFALVLLIVVPGCDSGDTFQLPLEPDPILSLSTNSLTFGTGEIEKTISISNLGGGFLTWEARVSEEWISLSESSGTEGDQLTITVDRSALDPGEYNATVSFFTNGLDGSLFVTLVLTLEESLIGTWSVVGAESGANQLETLIATFTFIDTEQYTALYDDGTNRGTITAQYEISGKTFLSNLPASLQLNGMSEASDGTWTADMSSTEQAFTEYGATALGWANEDGLQIDIENGIMSLITQDGTISFLYERVVDP